MAKLSMTHTFESNFLNWLVLRARQCCLPVRDNHAFLKRPTPSPTALYNSIPSTQSSCDSLPTLLSTWKRQTSGPALRSIASLLLRGMFPATGGLGRHVHTKPRLTENWKARKKRSDTARALSFKIDSIICKTRG
ncbi:hypothetical protein LshimejAT787_0411830 [Lyophyllum shimeji]|uniref:Uncharacterized protein n=1 Tax=Lyophyllum shimeji TaxID=47721 RepID=A0A9P3PMQ5_LYOSH|nr:hypothetical protein LshimejAT787_0411830 [Lyophyllum shimeji]